MKRIIIVLGIFITIIGCNSKAEKNDKTVNKLVETEVPTADCIALEDIGTFKDPKDMADYLKNNYKDFCDKSTWWKMVYRAHKITKEEFDAAVKAAIDSGQGASPYTTKSWSDISALFATISANNIYDTYITFKPDGTNPAQLNLLTINTFTTEPSCYSIALFKSIEQKFGTDVSEMTFKFIELRNIKQVYFQVIDKDGVTAIYCNISTDPT